eukprot:TRINITY_DN16271_c0_g1_i5.p1 TRINITY_DN16271_c0_g1~~TRINITY_DN16271_c0_g1_i5.p1  ORF type:complete len:558 (+),score=130.56 TRINITY_DN16271_c0_g1_i5:200-1873(+)
MRSTTAPTPSVDVGFQARKLHRQVTAEVAQFQPLIKAASLPKLRSGGSAKKRGDQKSAGVRTAQAINEVRSLAHDKPEDTANSATEGSHDALLARLKSFRARQEAESLRRFVEKYRNTKHEDKESETILDRQLKATEKKAEELRLYSDKLREEVADAERYFERCTQAVSTRQANPSVNVQESMTAFERAQYLVQEDKREEELRIQNEQAQNAYLQVHRRLQSHLIELRDYKVLLGQYRRLRLEKLQENLGRVTDGRKLRSIIREMIRQGGQKMLQRLEATAIPLEPWMREVLVNCCHLEIRMEDAEHRLLPLRQDALQPVHSQVERMVKQPMNQRFGRLCAWTWDSLQDAPAEANPWRRPQPATRSISSAQRSVPVNKVNRERDFHAQFLLKQMRSSRNVEEEFDKAAIEDSATPTKSPREESEGSIEAGFPSDEGLSESIPLVATTEASTVIDTENAETMHHRGDFAGDKPEVRNAEAELLALRRLLTDTRVNAAAAICNRIQQADKGSVNMNNEHRMGETPAMAWGKQMLTLLVSEDFAKEATKQLRKTQSQLRA